MGAAGSRGSSLMLADSDLERVVTRLVEDQVEKPSDVAAEHPASVVAAHQRCDDVGRKDSLNGDSAKEARGFADIAAREIAGTVAAAEVAAGTAEGVGGTLLAGVHFAWVST